ncbi:RNA-guided endonuclease TnpB family protein [Nostoc sp. FACHB-110]|uniref:RNA-guided endonuclease InsQ/TnpB family protein n=1 Tax=Nostoc sp. FACHB-110 TaxID=2692834 RepID=UPI00168496AE|nr:RNA-guided endonuclease TnpB family protein [Nostoc sp. FACHB-110]MBD2437135.1 IS200/IS605 family element transposase accessory protein TnpB [Nostoc sp. FACHB-110]
MKRTVSIPVELPSERFFPLMNQCAEIFNAHVDWSIANSTYNKNKAHKELYHLLRVQFPSVPSALLQTVRDNALEAIKATKFKSIPKKKPTSGLRYDKRTMTLRGKQLTLSCIGKRVTLILDVPEYFREVFETWDFCGATVTYTKNTKRKVRAEASSELNLSGREKRFMKDTNHCVSKKLSNQPGVAVFVLEDLSSIRTQRRGKKMNKWLGSWAFYQQEQFLSYKAEALGKRVVHQDPRYTSAKCNICKHIRRTNRHKSRFHCKNCGHRTHADLNAAKNIRDDYILYSTQGTEEQASVNMPDVSTDSLGQLQAPSTRGWGG